MEVPDADIVQEQRIVRIERDIEPLDNAYTRI
jgi:hypothetical protein